MKTTADKRRSFAWLPRTTFWRVMLATIALGCLTLAAVMIVASMIGRNMVYDIQEENGYTVLRSAVELIGRTSITRANSRKEYVDKRKDALRSLIEFTVSLLDSFRNQAEQGVLGEEEARRAAFRHLQSMTRDFYISLFILDRKNRLMVHQNSDMVNQPLAGLDSPHDGDALQELVRHAKRNNDRTLAFRLHQRLNPYQSRIEPKLAAALYYKPWGMTICADLFLGDMDNALSDVYLAQLDELRARINEFLIAKTGYLFLFSEDCTMIAHPSLSEKDFLELQLPGSNQTMCEASKKAAIKPWGANKLTYRWDRPDDKGSFSHRKIAWFTREPTTGWYVGATVYIDELQGMLPRFVWSIFLPALGAILLFGGAVALLLRRRLKPVERLARVCQQVSAGDMTVRAEDDAPGEVGDLCEHFNDMIQRLEEARAAERERSRELTILNRDLEIIVEQRTGDLESKAAKLEEANIRLTGLDRMKSAFLSSVSHELRTPLTSVLGFAKLIHKEFERSFQPLAGEEKLQTKAVRILNNLDIIENEGERLTRLINDVLDLNKIESGRMEWRDKELRVEALIRQATRSVGYLIKQKSGVELQATIKGGLPVIRADQDRMLQVLINLLSNAIKFTDSGTIRISATPNEQAGVLLEVSDTGVGIPKSDLTRIFDKFHQVTQHDTLVEKPQGTGLGLSICRQIVEHYHGRIWAESELGRGARIFVDLPGEKNATGEDPAPDSQTRVPGAGPSILVVDEDLAASAYLSRLLKSEGYSILRAFDGESALRLAKACTPDLIFMDIMMPAMDGEAAVAQLRATPKTASIPILAAPALQDGEEAGEDAAPAKTVDEKRLMDAVDCLLNKRCADQSFLALKKGNEADLGALSTLCPESIRHCNQQEFWRFVQEGFQGVIILPDLAAARELGLGRLSSLSGVQVVILPGDAADHA
ncbi:MAG: ATP-binding protein [Desulfovibrionaceae bacterium]